MQSSAIISPCGTYRYRLSRRWGKGPWVTFVMLNPSTADHAVDDPTIRKCIGFARRMGLHALEVVNLFALRSTCPKALKGHADPVGPDNDKHIVEAGIGAARLVFAWGVHGELHGRDSAVTWLLKRMGVPNDEVLGRTSKGHPRHPLYVPYDAVPERAARGLFSAE